MRDVTVGEVAESVVNADFYYEEGETGRLHARPAGRRGPIVTSRKSKYAFYLRGFARAPIVDVRIADCTFDGVAQPEVIESVRDLALSNVRINGQLRNERISR